LTLTNFLSGNLSLSRTFASIPQDVMLPSIALLLDASDTSKFNWVNTDRTVTSWTSSDTSAVVFSSIQANTIVRQPKKHWKNNHVVCIPPNSNMGLQSTAFLINSLFGANGKDQTVFIVTQADDPLKTFQNIYYQYVSAANGHYFRVSQTASNFRWLAVSSTNFIAGSNSTLVARPVIITLQRQADVVRGWVNGQKFGSDVASASTAATATSQVMFLGTSSVSGGGTQADLAEIRIYKDVVSDSDRIKIEDYLAYKWIEGIQ
jgi:hypothetical protein